MPSRLGLRLLALIVSAVLVLPAAAHADRAMIEDGVGDAEAYTADQAFQFVPAPQEASVDITRTVAAFGHRRLGVTVHFRDLETRARHETRLRIRTPHDTFEVMAERQSASRSTVAMKRRGGETFQCRGLTVGYDGAADTVSLSVPAACIGVPRWVRLGVKARATPRTNPDNPSTIFFFADDGHRDDFRDGSIGMGPRIGRG